MKYVTFAVLASALVLGFTAAPAVAQDNVAGAWELTMETPQGANTVNVTLKQDADKVTGEMTSPMGSVPVTGTFTGGTLALTANIEVQGMAFALGFNGKVAGDTFNGNVKAGDFGEFPFTGKRSAAPAAPAVSVTATAPGAATAAASGDVSGKWDITLTIAGAGEFPVTAMLKQDGTKISGTFISQAGEVAVTGTMTGSALKLEFNAETPQGALPVTLTGELGAEGFTGKASIAGMGEADWKGIRGK